MKKLKTLFKGNTNLSIIGVKRIENFCLNFILNYNICVIEKDKNGNKFFIDFNNHNKINLSNHNIVSDTFHFKSNYYFIKMIDSSICEWFFSNSSIYKFKLFINSIFSIINLFNYI